MSMGLIMADPNAPLPPLISNPEENEGPRIFGAVTATTALALATVITRFYVRSVMIRNFGWDDILMVITMMTSLAGYALIVVEVLHGAGRHRGDVDPEDYAFGVKINFITQPVYLYAICFVKLSVGATLLRIATTKFYRFLIFSVMAFMLFYTIGCFFTIILQCTDIRILWDPTVPSVCWDTKILQGLSYTNIALNVFTDILLAIVIPTPMLWHLNVHRRTRISLLAILGLGVFACAASFVKLSYIVNYGKPLDVLYDTSDITIWTVTELNIGITAASLSCLRPLFRRFLGSSYGKRSFRTGTTGEPNAQTRETAKERHKSGRGKNTNCGGNVDEDDTSSQKGINLGRARSCIDDEFELSERRSRATSFQFLTTIVGGASSLDDDGDDEKSDSGRSIKTCDEERGIKKTMVTTVNYSSRG